MQQNLNKTSKHMLRHLKNSKLGNVTVFTATSTTAPSNRYSDELALT